MRKRAAFLIGTGCILLSASVSLAVNNQLESAKAAKSAETLAEAYLSRSTVFEAPVTDTAANAAQTEAPDVSETRSAAEHSPAKRPVVIDGQEFIGLLSIPCLGVNLPVNNDISYPLLRATPCRYYGSAETDSLIIAAHNYNSHFGGIGTLKPGDKVNFTDSSGITQAFSVSEVLSLTNDAVDEMLEPGDWDLTLFTCNYSGTERITVRCVKGERI